MSETLAAPLLQAPPSVRNWRDWVGLVARVVVGLVFVYAGFVKIDNIPLFIHDIELYQIPFLQEPVSDALGHVLPIVEIVVGVLLVAGLLTRWAALATGIMLLGFIAGIAWVWSQGISIDCGCFGAGGAVDPEDTNYPIKVLENAGMTALCAWLFVRPTSLFSADHLLFGAPVHLSSLPDDDLEGDDVIVAETATKEK